MADVARVVDALGEPLDRFQELGIGRPRPLDAGFHGSGGNVLGALQVAHHHVLVLLRARRQREAAVAHHDRRDAVVAGRRGERVPENLRVHVRVAVHESRGDDLPLGVYALPTALADAPYRRDPAAAHAGVRPEPGHAGTVDYRAILDYEVVGHAGSPCESSWGILHSH